MRRSYFRRRNALFSSPARVALVAALALVALAAAVRLIAPGAFFAAAAPALMLGSAASAGADGFFASFGDGAAKDARIEELTAQVRALSNENLALAARLADAGLPAEGGEGAIPAGVIARPPMAPYDMLILGAGAADGVVPGALVTAEGGVPVGTVTSVASRTSQATLFSAPGRVSEGWMGEERLPVTLSGKGSGAFFAEVPRDAAVAEGDLVYLPGPGALPMGRVARVETDPASPSSVVRIAPLANPFSLTFVAILPAL